MKLKFPALLAGSCLLATTLLHAQEWQFLSGKDYNLPENRQVEFEGTYPDGSGQMVPMSYALTSLSSSPQVSLTGNEADTIYPEISNLADSLGDDPARIYEFVLNTIDYEHYYGSKRGARLTLLEGTGNDLDQASLLVSLLRAAGYSAGYASQWDILYYEIPTVPTYPTAVTWLGLDGDALPGVTLTPAEQNFCTTYVWTELQYKQVVWLRDVCKVRGFDVASFSDLKGAVLIRRIVAVVDINGTTYKLDPSAKPYSTPDRIDVLGMTGFNLNSFLTAVGGTETSNYVTGLSETAIQTKLGEYTQTLICEIKNSDRSGESMDALLGIGDLVQKSIESISSDQRYLLPSLNAGAYLTEYFSEVPDSEMSTLELQINQSAIYSLPMPELAGQRLSVTNDGSTVRVWLEDTQLFTRTVSANTYELTMRATHPHYRSATQDDVNAGLAGAVGDPIAFDDGEITNVYKRNDDFSYALIYAFSPSQRFFYYRNEVLDDILQEVREYDSSLFGEDGALDLSQLNDGSLKRRVVTEVLNVMGLNWLYQTNRTNGMCASLTDTNVIPVHRFGRMAQEEGYFVDVGLQRVSNVPRNGMLDHNIEYLFTGSYLRSALEHGIIDQYEFEDNSAVSTIQILHLANSSSDTNKNRIYYANSANWSSVSGELNGYSATDLQSFADLLAAGEVLILPRSKDNGDSDWDWSGSGYIRFGISTFTTTIGMMLTGDFETSGGWNTRNSLVSTAPVYRSNIASPAYSNYSGISSISLAKTPSWTKPSYYSWDPVDMATGSFVFDHDDLSLGSEGSLGLSFARHYSSSRRNINTSNLGFGWTHSYDIRATERTAPEAGLGETTIYDSATMLAAIAVITELVGNPEDLKETVSGALLAKCAIDDLLNNAVSVRFGKNTVQFVRQADGSFVTPAGSTMELTETTNEWVVQERFGPAWTFDRTNDGRLTEVEDQFSQTQTFSYNTEGKLETVTDAYGRTLTLSYQDDLLSTVTDSTGRSVSFQYDTDKRLTHATGPESDTAQFFYDDENCITELRDPEGRIIVQNHYDSESRVEQQVSEGNTLKTWVLAFSGFQNVETDPLGADKVYEYDQSGRALATVDAEGNRTSMSYDGLDRVVRQVSPGGLETRSLYDPNNNLVVQSVAPVGVIAGFSTSDYQNISVQYYSGVPHEGMVTLYAYDSLNRVLGQQVKDLSGATPDRVTTYHYNSGNTTNLPDSATDAEENQTLFTYYADGLLNTQTEVSSTGNRTTTYTYDSRGMPATISYPDDTSESFVYNERGDMTSHTDRRNHTTTYQYNNRRQVTHTTTPDTGTTINAYDDNGRLLSVTDPEENVTRYTYSAQGKLLTETTAYGTPEAATTTHEYDECDRLVRTIDPCSV